MLDRGEVVELSADGTFDIDRREIAWDVLKAEGNDSFQKKDYYEAMKKYSAALEGAPSSEKYLLYGNRATCFFQLRQYREALDEVNIALELEPTWEKGHSRKKCILQAIAKQKKFQVPLGSVYSDKAQVIPDSNESKSSHMLWRRLKSGLDNANQDCLDGVFARLMNEVDFRQVMYPGMTSEDIERQKLPRSLKQLLEDPWYESEMIDLMPKVQAKANLVLENVKQKGATQGDYMDATTEAILRPQIFREAFGREVLAMLQRVSVQKHAMLAKDSSRIADPQAECATWNLLNDHTLSNLFGNQRFGVQDNFLGDEYIPLLQSDVNRMWKQGQLLSVGGAHARILDVSSAESNLADSFPALMELLEKLHALPHEINKKKLSELCSETSLACSTTLICFQPGESQPLRLDCGQDATHDNGYKLTTIYCINSGLGGGVLLRPSDSNEGETISAVADRLIVYQSQHVLNAVTPVISDHCQFFVLFRIHGLRL